MSLQLHLIGAVAIIGLVSAARAEVSNDAIITAFEGYDYVEIERGTSEIKVEGIRDGMFVEVLYDAQTGAILDQSTRPARTDDRSAREEGSEMPEADGEPDDSGSDDGGDADEPVETADRNRGHGNDADGFDEDNPGRGHGDGNRGGGNGNGRGNGNGQGKNRGGN